MSDPPYSLNQYKKAVGATLKELRIQHGVTQEEIADKVNMDRSHLSGLEAGDHDPGSFKLAQIAAVYGMTLVEVVTQIEAKALTIAARAARRKEKNNRK